ncbi:ABC transporter substrate-binding protein [Pseudomonas sp.]|uniref:ABC transporter substrate-binding protein n=1 Tax=Pseudomonas sp. TaxID=306 RepID=UPI0026388482|nr:ABC transporter substrate-binding protein [Pseudomonas sp.]
MINEKLRIAKVLMIIASIGFLSACSPSDDKDKGNTQAAAVKPATVKWAYSLPTSWDPVTSRTGADINTISLPYASLTRLDNAGAVQPSLAKSWVYNEDGTRITFELRDGLTFTDGTPLDANAVKAFFERGKNQKNSFLKDQLAEVQSISAEGATKVTLRLSEPNYQIPYLLAGRTGAISSPAAAEKDLGKLSLWPVGAGPFKMVDFVTESHAYFEKNPNYWDAANIHIDRLELTVTPDSSTLVASVLSGSIDIASLPARKVKEAKASGLDVTIAPSLSVRDISINLNKAPFTDPRVVEAFRYAFNRQEFIDVITAGTGSIVHQPFPQGHLAFNPEIEKLWSYDPDRAIKLLAEAGYGPGDLSIVITNSASADENSAELLQSQLAKIGVKSVIKLVPPGSSTWQSEVYIAKTPQLALDGTIGRESPVQNLLAVYGPDGIMNLSGPHATDEFVDALRVVRKTPLDNPDYQRVLWAAEEIGVKQSPTNYIYANPWVIVSSPKLKNLNIQPSQVRWEGVTVK